MFYCSLIDFIFVPGIVALLNIVVSLTLSAEPILGKIRVMKNKIQISEEESKATVICINLCTNCAKHTFMFCHLCSILEYFI